MNEAPKVKEQILRYLKANPHAGDTKEGIAHWWLLRQHVADSFHVVQQAMDELKQEHLVVERKSERGESMYFAVSRGKID